MVIAYHMVQKGIEKGYKQGYAEGYAEGYAKGYAQGLAEVRADAARLNKAYYNRMRAALDTGEDFTEPPPKLARRPR